MNKTGKIKFGEYKLQKFSRGYYIAVPKVVVRSWNLDVGSSLVWIFEDGRLTLAPTCEKNTLLNTL